MGLLEKLHGQWRQLSKTTKLGFTISLVFLFWISSANATTYDACICQTGVTKNLKVGTEIISGTGRVGESFFYWLGCKAYLAVTSCKKTYIVPVNQDIQSILNSHPREKVNLSYFGHWENSEKETLFLKNYVLPGVRSSGCEIDIYNSACRAGNDAEAIYQWMQSLEPVLRENIQFTGNQAISSGGWDALTAVKNNFSVTVDADGVHFPGCQEFEGQLCSKGIQLGEVGICEDKQTGKSKFLICAETGVRKVTSPTAGKPGQGAVIRANETKWLSFHDPKVKEQFLNRIPDAKANEKKRTKNYAIKKAREYFAENNLPIPTSEELNQAMDTALKITPPPPSRGVGLLGNLEFQSFDELENFITQAEKIDPREFLKYRAQVRSCP